MIRNPNAMAYYLKTLLPQTKMDIRSSYDHSAELFPERLYSLLEEAEQIGLSSAVSWLPNGMAFAIKNEDVFVNHAMPRYFAATKIRSFHRSLNLWGFHKLVSNGSGRRAIAAGDDGADVWWHELFIRGRRQDLKLMKRTRVKGRSSNTVSEPKTIPNAATIIKKSKPAKDSNVKADDEVSSISTILSLDVDVGKTFDTQDEDFDYKLFTEPTQANQEQSQLVMASLHESSKAGKNNEKLISMKEIYVAEKAIHRKTATSSNAAARNEAFNDIDGDMKKIEPSRFVSLDSLAAAAPHKAGPTKRAGDNDMSNLEPLPYHGKRKAEDDLSMDEDGGPSELLTLIENWNQFEHLIGNNSPVLPPLLPFRSEETAPVSHGAEDADGNDDSSNEFLSLIEKSICPP